ncbi:MAG: DUF1343 domain-containing protein [Bacteroidetes bacterium]|nr:DUF1343 domain-containing protein [Bacteroidota bacterium]
MFSFFRICLLSIVFCLFSTVCCFSQFATPLKLQDKTSADLKVGAQQTEKYFPLLKDKRIAVVAHPASMVKNTHLVDTLVRSGFKVKKIFAPEHGFRGDAEAGEKIKNNMDAKTGLPVISLYGKNFKPKPEELKDVDVVLFDLQDVGARFYTYLSTLHYVMEACAENKKQLIILDRPNPNGYFVDGPVLEPKFKSFSGMHPVPIVYGMTIGEYARMINGEKWLANGVQCKLEVISVDGYTHNDLYQLPVKPSPNLPNMSSVYLYPTLCLFEGTIVSVGRGTDKPFQQFGYPELKAGNDAFTPHPVNGASENPMYNGQLCWGFDVSAFGEMYVKYYEKINLFWMLNLYKTSPLKEKFFNNYFNSLAGNETLQKQIKEDKTEEEIRNSWEEGLTKFKQIRKKYIIYPDFE